LNKHITNTIALLATCALLGATACGADPTDSSDAAGATGNRDTDDGQASNNGANNGWGSNNGTNNGGANNGWDGGPANNGHSDEDGPNPQVPGERPIENDWTDTAQDNLATFSIDVDTASYTATRQSITAGFLPEASRVRTEEFINFFRYDYEAPEALSREPFAINLESAPSPFGQDKHLLKVGIKGKEVPLDERPATNLVFLIDVSGSMTSARKLPLVKHSLTTLLSALRPQDTLGIVVYAGRDAILLEPTRVEERGTIHDAIEMLRAGGSTNGAGGIRTAYELAQSAFVEGGINRVVLCTDGDFNVGVTGAALVDLVVSWNDRDIALTVLGYGRGFNDSFLEDLTNRANGNYAFIDNEAEALRVLGENLISTLQIIAKDVKIQIELDPQTVARYRVVGYINRAIADDDFDDDTVDAGEIGSGHTVTAFLELELHEGVEDGSLGVVNIRYKKPDEDVSDLVERSISLSDMHAELTSASEDFRFAAAVAEFGEILAGSRFAEDGDLDRVLNLAEGAVDEDGQADRVEFLALVARARQLRPGQP
jgi:Ca-activated chloride channel family protein